MCKPRKNKAGINGSTYQLGSTAITCARTRAYYTNMLYAQDILDEVTSGSQDLFSEFWHNFLRSAVHIFPKLMTRAAILEGRYISTSDAIAIVGECDFLEYGAGLSPRSLEYAVENVFYMETDQPEVISAKQRIVEKIRGKEGGNIAPGHHFFSINPVNPEELRRAGQLYNSQASRKPLVILHEGLLEWQTREEQIILRDNNRDFLKEYSSTGVWISPDFTFTTKDNFVMKLIMRKMQRDVGRKLMVFESDVEVQDFLSDGGLKGERISNEHLIGKLTCINKIGISERKVRELSEHFQAYYIMLK